MKIGWIGFGKKGIELVNSLIYFGHEVYGYNRTYQKMNLAVENGLVPCQTISEVVKNSDVIFTLLSDSNAVYEVYCEEGGIFKSCEYLEKKITCIDLSTCSAKLVEYLYNNHLGIDFLDAPFIFEKNLQQDSIFYYYLVGGKEEVFKKHQRLFNCFGSNVFYVGKIGSGQIIKKAAELSILGSTLGMIEMLEYAKSKKLDLNKLYNATANGAGSSEILKETFLKIINDDYEIDFSNKLAKEEIESMIKDSPYSPLILAKVIYGIFKKLNENETILTMNKFYEGNKNE